MAAASAGGAVTGRPSQAAFLRQKADGFRPPHEVSVTGPILACRLQDEARACAPAAEPGSWPSRAAPSGVGEEPDRRHGALTRSLSRLELATVQQTVSEALERDGLTALSQRKLNALGLPLAYVDRNQRYRFVNNAFLDLDRQAPRGRHRAAR